MNSFSAALLFAHANQLLLHARFEALRVT